jgi:hypothetical protein
MLFFVYRRKIPVAMVSFVVVDGFLRERAAVAVVLLLVLFYNSCILIGQSQLFEGSNKFIRGSNTDPLFAVFKNLFDPRINKSFIIRHSVSHKVIFCEYEYRILHCIQYSPPHKHWP